MKPTKNTLIEELEDRLKLATNATDSENKILNDILSFEIGHLHEMISLVNYFGDKIGYAEFEKSKYTPIKDYYTQQPLKIGDFVTNTEKRICGTLEFESHWNRYIIRSATGGNHYTTNFVKIEKLFDYSIDNTMVECRKSPNKTKW